MTEFREAIDGCPFRDCAHRHRSRELLLEAIRVLEDTRKAFKSKQLEVLRNKLIGALADSRY